MAHSNMQGPGAEVRATGCTISHNSASGLWALAGARVRLTRCTLSSNECNGAACWDVASSLCAHGCEFADNTLHGVRVLHCATAALRGCQLHNNRVHALETGNTARVELDRCKLSGASHLCTSAFIPCPN